LTLCGGGEMQRSSDTTRAYALMSLTVEDEAHTRGLPLRLTGGGEHEERAVDLDSSQRVRDHLVAYHLAPAITDFILDENWACYNNKLEQTLTLLRNEWSTEIEPSRQNSTHHLLIV